VWGECVVFLLGVQREQKRVSWDISKYNVYICCCCGIRSKEDGRDDDKSQYQIRNLFFLNVKKKSV